MIQRKKSLDPGGRIMDQYEQRQSHGRKYWPNATFAGSYVYRRSAEGTGHFERKSYGKEIQTSLSSEEFALGTPFHFSQEAVKEIAKRKNEIFQAQQLKQLERS